MMKMKRLTTILFVLALTTTAMAQHFNTPQQQQQQAPKFSPEKFQADLEQFITKEACLTPREAAKFFPIYKEMQAKQRAVYERQRQLGWGKPADEKGCEKAIRQRDEYDLELKRIQQTYHLRFLETLSASKVYDILRAEEKFHRNMMRSWGRGPRPQQPQQGMPQR